MKYLQVYKNKLPGFTLLEQIIVLALITILVLIGFTAVLNFQKLLLKVRDNAAKDRSVYLFHQVLDSDLRAGGSAGWDGGLNIEKPTGTVRYEFENLYLIRQCKEAIDTFRFVATDVIVTGVYGNNKLVEEISFNLTDQIQTYKMSFTKKYPAYKVWENTEYGN